MSLLLVFEKILEIDIQECLNKRIIEKGSVMTVNEVIDHYGSIKLAAKALSVTYQCVHNWKGDGVPAGVQSRIQLQTGGVLLADPYKQPAP